MFGSQWKFSLQRRRPPTNTLGVQGTKAFLLLGLLIFLGTCPWYCVCVGGGSPLLSSLEILSLHKSIVEPSCPPTSSWAVFTAGSLPSPHCAQHPVIPPGQAGPRESTGPQGRSVFSILCCSHVHYKSRKEFLPGGETHWTEKIKSSRTRTHIPNI